MVISSRCSDQPQLIPADPVARLPELYPRSIDEAKSALVRQLILIGTPDKEVDRQSGVGSTVSKISQQIKANVMLFHSTEVRSACPNQNIAPTKAQMGAERDSYLFAKIEWALQDSNLRQHRYERAAPRQKAKRSGVLLIKSAQSGYTDIQ